jgi:nucleoside-diphosphate-sugar epimerase
LLPVPQSPFDFDPESDGRKPILKPSGRALEAASRARARRVVLCSTLMVYGGQNTGPLGEDAPLRP